MAKKREPDIRKKPSPSKKVDKNERFSLYPLATEEALRTLLQNEADREADESADKEADGD